MRHWSEFTTVPLIFFGILSINQISHASTTEEAYRKALEIAEKSLQKKSNLATANALSSSLVKSLYGRYYKVGDTWEIAAWVRENQNMRRVTLDPSNQSKVGRGGLFRYEVTSVKTGAQPEVTLQVTQVPDDQNELPVIDSSVETLTLKMNDQYIQSEKIFKFTNSVRASSRDVRTTSSLWELLPLDAPEVSLSLRQKATTLPVLPEKAQKVAERLHFKPNLENSSWFDQDDFFGRPVEVLWQQGDPWPTYVKTPTGISILIRRGTQ